MQTPNTSVVKRDGRREHVSFDKILKRVSELCYELKSVDAVRVAQRVIQGVHDNVKTSDLDDLAAESAAALASQHPEYALLAGRIAVSNLHKMTVPSVFSVLHVMSDEVRAFAERFLMTLDKELKFENDMKYDYFGFKTLERSYLVKDDAQRVVERPQVMLMRVALGIHVGDVGAVLETYNMMSERIFTHATPTMFNSGTKFAHLASCFLLPVEEDSIIGIFNTVRKTAEISKAAGGIGFSVSNVRAAGSAIVSTGGTSSGLLPFLRVFESTARAVDQGGGKRKGAFAAYLEPWHADVRIFIEMKKNHGVEELRARDLFYALWIPDLFMRRVKGNQKWTLFCPSKCPDLIDLCGEAFDARYEEYERQEGVAVSTLPAQELWFAILDAQIETGTPYMLYKDACNLKSNHMNLGTIRSSNLCTEVVQYSSADEIAVCNLASLSLPAFVRPKSFVEGDMNLIFDFVNLFRATCVVTRNLNRVIDRNCYAREEARNSNRRHRPIGIGVQGLADVFAMLDLPFDSQGARDLNRDIFETIYYASLDASCVLAEKDGAYETFKGSPTSQGKLQMDLWNVTVTDKRWDWTALRMRIAKFGLRNSLLVAPMPTASTAQILNNNECFEPFTSNLYVRRVLAGEFAVVNKHLVRRLDALGLWTDEIRTSIIAGNGSVQHVPQIPDNVKAVFKTVWEMSMRTLIDLSAERAPFVDQSQSLNLFVEAPTHAKLTSMHFYAWNKGLKTGMYYLRTKPAADAVKVTVPVEAVKATASEEVQVCRMKKGVDDVPCEACSA